jgi:hypothetical protein
VWAFRTILRPALAVLVFGGVARGEDIGDPAMFGKSNGGLHGYLLIGAKRYTVDGAVRFDGTRLEGVKFSVMLDAGATSIEIVSQADGNSTVIFSGRKYLVPNDMLAGWGDALVPGRTEVELSGEYTRSSGDDGISCESKSFVWLGPCFPAKVRYLYGVGRVGLSPSGPCQVVVYSLAEWNNPFHETVLLHLFLKGPKEGAEQ